MKTKTRKPGRNTKLFSIKGGREKTAESPPDDSEAAQTNSILVIYVAALIARVETNDRWPLLHKDPEKAAKIAIRVLELAMAAFVAMGQKFDSTGFPLLCHQARLRLEGPDDLENAVRILQAATILAQKVLSESRAKFEMTGYAIHIEGEFKRAAAFCTNGFVREVDPKLGEVLWVPVAMLSPLGIEIDKILGRLELRTFELNSDHGDAHSVACVRLAELPSFLCKHDPALVLDFAAREKLMRFHESIFEQLEAVLEKDATAQS
jgi:hypothetical protein